MNILLVISSILAVTCFVWILNRFLPYKVCAICAGVSGTWLAMLGARFFGYSVDPAMLAMLLGGSVVGSAYQLEKKIGAEEKKLLWKILFIPAGFVTSYGVVYEKWYAVFGALVFLVLVAYVFLKASGKQEANKTVKELEEKMKQCC